MKSLQQDNQPKLGVCRGLLQSNPRALALLETDSVSFHSLVGELSFFRCQPSSGEGMIGQDEGREDSYTDSDCSEDDEEPSPAGKTVFAG